MEHLEEEMMAEIARVKKQITLIKQILEINSDESNDNTISNDTDRV